MEVCNGRWAGRRKRFVTTDAHRFTRMNTGRKSCEGEKQILRPPRRAQDDKGGGVAGGGAWRSRDGCRWAGGGAAWKAKFRDVRVSVVATGGRWRRGWNHG